MWRKVRQRCQKNRQQVLLYGNESQIMPSFAMRKARYSKRAHVCSGCFIHDSVVFRGWFVVCSRLLHPDASMLRKPVSSTRHSTGPGGGIGRRDGLKHRCRKACRFDSGPGHHAYLHKKIGIARSPATCRFFFVGACQLDPVRPLYQSACLVDRHLMERHAAMAKRHVMAAGTLRAAGRVFFDLA